MLKDFAAIDFETANGYRSSVCSVGMIFVHDGQIADSFYSLIHPSPNYYNHMNTQIHGLTHFDTDDAEDFPQVWQSIVPRLGDLPLVAHNSAFDESCLKAVFAAYGLSYPQYRFYCTYRAGRRLLRGLPNYQLHTVAAACGFDMRNHHHALADAEACARIAIRLFCNDDYE